MRFFTFARYVLFAGIQLRRHMVGPQRRLPRYRAVLGSCEAPHASLTIVELDAAEGMIASSDSVTLFNGNVRIGEPLEKSLRVIVSRCVSNVPDNTVFVMIKAPPPLYWQRVRGISVLFVPAPLAYDNNGEYCGFRDGGALIMHPGDAIAMVADDTPASLSSVLSYDPEIYLCVVRFMENWQTQINDLRSPRSPP